MSNSMVISNDNNNSNGTINTTKNKDKSRPARVQVDPESIDTEERPPQTGTVFNIWYNKWSGGDREDKYLNQRHANNRCNIKRDSGYTKADFIKSSYFCLYFAMGMCINGEKCEYLHRLPDVLKGDVYPPTVDCFGREKFSDYRDDMGGTGSFNRENRTIYIGRITDEADIEEKLSRHFSEWGKIERTRVLNGKGCAFITYVDEINAQFAKVAMAHQSLDGDEVLNIRWANEDPNPMAKIREQRRLEERAAEVIRGMVPQEFLDEIEGKANKEGGRKQKKRRIEKRSDYGLEGYKAPEEILYSKNTSQSIQQIPENVESYVIESEITTESDDKGRNALVSSSVLNKIQALRNRTRPARKPTAVGILGILGDYDSDDDE